MRQTARPRRSVLYMPGSNARAQEKAKSLPADALILDLEDAVAPDAKAEARGIVCDNVRSGGYGGRELIIRVNGLETPWGRDDLVAAAGAGADAILLPKVESGQQVRAAEALMDAHGAAATTAIWCMMETPRGILQAAEIAGSTPRLGCLVMGTSDLTKDLHARHTQARLPMLTSLGLCLLAARAHDLAILDGVYLDLANGEGFAESCRQGLELGFDGKTLIHPSQVAGANEIFGPTAAEIAESKEIITAFAAADAAGKAVVVVNGRLVENLHVENARRIVEMAAAIEALESGAA
ncbi:HpcH/HpaI aldolase/citrate lyase family protein [Oceanibacterium hippocampi]|uniref:(3S)-malyl-CoA thioesterase n=1 Tax=Oceanibacterium hippocampi TaxID=745714 RepID=A0A1Y5RCU5_9PROT|nr:CoA ester lyase [Oceanibacterium hippocampi]SLN14123.1 (3S)-malyl-CoA thioesterase [Oceanibacterium hippocampi]